MLREWDATTYDSLPLPHVRWGRQTLERFSFAGDETVLEAGCGTGRDTEALLDALPRGRVIAVDGSARMLERLRERLAGRLDRVEAIQADLTRPLPISAPADAAFSVATFHWIHDHDALFAGIARALRPGARFVADCGGKGNVAVVRAAVEDVLGGPPTSGTSPTRRRPACGSNGPVSPTWRPAWCRIRRGWSRASSSTAICGPWCSARTWTGSRPPSTTRS
jgi:trans-aconitate 2-methyltransferase